MKNLLKKIAILSIAMFFFSCSEDGKDGEPGADGNANVIGTSTVTSSNSNWTSGASGTLWTTTLNVPGITQSIVDRGIVSVFKRESTGFWTPLPYTFANESWHYTFNSGTVLISRLNINLTPLANPGSQTFRVVIISASNRIAYPNVNWNNYAEVKDIFKLKD
jgi:hypothetical protein